MAKQKTVNYDADTMARMEVIYLDAEKNHPDILDPYLAQQEAVKEIQIMTGKSLASIRSKLGDMEIYKPKPKVVKKGGKRVTKNTLVTRLGEGDPAQSEGFFDSIEGSRYEVIEYVLNQQKLIAELEHTLSLEGVQDAIQAALEVDENAATE